MLFFSVTSLYFLSLTSSKSPATGWRTSLRRSWATSWKPCTRGTARQTYGRRGRRWGRECIPPQARVHQRTRAFRGVLCFFPPVDVSHRWRGCLWSRPQQSCCPLVRYSARGPLVNARLKRGAFPPVALPRRPLRPYARRAVPRALIEARVTQSVPTCLSPFSPSCRRRLRHARHQRQVGETVTERFGGTMEALPRILTRGTAGEGVHTSSGAGPPTDSRLERCASPPRQTSPTDGVGACGAGPSRPNALSAYKRSNLVVSLC